MAPHGRSGGILLEVDLTVSDIGSIDEGDFYVKFTLWNKNDGYKWALFVVYGPAQKEHKESFLTEMAHICNKESLPYIIGGDFNIMRHPENKNKDNFDAKWPDLFNMVIQTLDLIEIEMLDPQYT